ncbi:MAG: single-stranded-DNA-specific exonuclease RecJ [Clostridia bacterium]|nr:single-stranded-DNA-specific exonuclease RecJ [Clostridia bacterium]
MKLKDERLIEFLNKKFDGNENKIEKFLNPSLDDFRDANLLPNIKQAVDKILTAIKQNKKILVYGDYDCDGISAATILYLHFKSLGANVSVFIPNRFENGYGISVDAIEEIIAEFSPELVVTVDLGITAVEEVEILKEEGIDVVITDHHLPLAEIPNTIVVDPKLESNYGFDGLCGAGVAFKLVEAMSGRDAALKYIDIAAIATIGDIVPLVDENRAIAKLGIDEINRGNTLLSIKHLLGKLELSKVNSTDISYKIVPRINACGRMDSADKMFEYLIETDENLLNEKYLEVEADNTLRLSFIEKGNKEIEKQLEGLDASNEAVILIKGNFHEGIVGILASRICHEFNKPSIIFTKTENGTLKGSGRSIPGIDLHLIISQMTDLLENFGGHKMAVGVEIEPENFDKFKSMLNEKLFEKYSSEDFLIKAKLPDIEITENDLNLAFYKEFEMLEPFGCENEKPTLAIIQKELNVERISERAINHYKIFTSKNNSILGFNFGEYVSGLRSTGTKRIFVDLSENEYKGQVQLSAKATSVDVVFPSFENCASSDFCTAVFNKYYSLFDFNNKINYHLETDIKQVIKSKLNDDSFGTLIICSNENDLKLINDLNLNNLMSYKPFKNGQNTVLVSPEGIHLIDSANGYKNIIFLHKYFNDEHLYFSQKFNVFEPSTKTADAVNLDKSREKFVYCYKLITKFLNLKAVDELDYVQRLSQIDKLVSPWQLMFCLSVFMELNFFEFDPVLSSMTELKAKKMELENSKMYSEVDNG